MKDRVALEHRRLAVLELLSAGAVSAGEAATLLGISERHLWRLLAARRDRGAEALTHGNRGRRPANAISIEVAARVVELATTTYVGFNQHHLTEMLAEHEGIALSRSSVRRILGEAGVEAPQQRRPPRHRSRRDRYAQEGMLLQVDGSRHDWLEGRGPWLSLVGGIDDATGRVPGACFREQEDAQGYFLMLRQVVRRHGIPLALYSDRHSIFHPARKQPTLDEQLSGSTQPTQFGRLLEELGVQLILARSPQAKGRIERLWGTLQDRLTSELRLVGASCRDDAEKVLTRYLPRHNQRFMVPAADPQLAWLPWPTERRLDEVFCFKYRRVVAHDNTVRFGAHRIDIPANRQRVSYARARVEIHQRFDGLLHVYHDGVRLASLRVDDQPRDLRVARGQQVPTEEPAARIPSAPRPPRTHPWKPAPNHPWR